MTRTTITPKKLADSFADLAAGGLIIPGESRDEWLLAFAKRLRGRIQPGDRRLATFDRHADATGYVWLPAALGPIIGRARREQWSFDRAFAAFIAVVEAAPTPAPETLDGARRDAEAMEAASDAGFRPVWAKDGGIVMEREP